ncbi:unnamed protein product [Cyprideis torosa]|uniref:NADH dehydrogenase [ubiquinone] iron-sulfur protein 3, mitochondrial n=1 Tax=Cyprideis torosa TaxID=163714 RepID=A0A7R8W3D6_9CRUS|nr:unnamed protein product [Cyprideis torosa]CAG0878751.1 unnamed protein product [Cyprideis torosa]
MSKQSNSLADAITTRFGALVDSCTVTFSEVTIEVSPTNLIEVCTALRDEPEFCFEQLVDLCGVDYLQYGMAEWEDDTSGASGFSRGLEPVTAGRLNFGDACPAPQSDRARFAVVSHLISYKNNQRIRIRCYAEDESVPVVPSLTELWSSADWNEREAFDLFGILFDGHQDLRRLLTDYGFVGHPFRKDFPLVGNVEMRYDPELQRVIYEPVTIEPRVLVPRVIRDIAAVNDAPLEDE